MQPARSNIYTMVVYEHVIGISLSAIKVVNKDSTYYEESFITFSWSALIIAPDMTKTPPNFLDHLLISISKWFQTPVAYSNNKKGKYESVYPFAYSIIVTAKLDN